MANVFTYIYSCESGASENSIQDEKNLPSSSKKNSQIVMERRCSKRKVVSTVEEDKDSYKVFKPTKAVTKANQVSRSNSQPKTTKKRNSRKKNKAIKTLKPHLLNLHIEELSCKTRINTNMYAIK